MTPPAELDRIERQLAAAIVRARELGWLPGPEKVHPSATYRELERLSGGGVIVPCRTDTPNRKATT